MNKQNIYIRNQHNFKPNNKSDKTLFLDWDVFSINKQESYDYDLATYRHTLERVASLLIISKWLTCNIRICWLRCYTETQPICEYSP